LRNETSAPDSSALVSFLDSLDCVLFPMKIYVEFRFNQF